MTIAHGIAIAVAAAAVTFVVIAAGGLAVVVLRIQEERHGTGCRGDGCRRRPDGQGCNTRPRPAEPVRGIFTKE